VAVGAATRLSDYLMHGRKCYRAGIRLGVRTDTDDAEGAVIDTQPVEGITREAVVGALAAFRGTIEQRPPAYAAIKKGGVPAYKLARRGVAPELAPRRVTVDALALLQMDEGALDVLVWCSAGTYIRALARDLGDALGCGAHLSALRRLHSGSFDVAEALSVTDLRDLAARGLLHERLAPLDRAVETWPAIIRSAEQTPAVLHGNAFAVDSPAPFGADRAGMYPPHDARVYAADGRLLALARYDDVRRRWNPAKVLVAPDDWKQGDKVALQ
jgi:tRNA pseudouridine55 synthase